MGGKWLPDPKKAEITIALAKEPDHVIGGLLRLKLSVFMQDIAINRLNTIGASLCGHF